MYSTEFGELAHKTQVKAEWRQSNKNNTSQQIVQSYSRQHSIRMRLLNLESLRRCGADLSPDVVEQLDTTSTTTAPDIRRRMLKGRRDDVANMADFSRILGVSIQMKEDAREFTVVDIGTILGLAHLIPEGDRRWIVNSRIDLRTFNKVY